MKLELSIAIAAVVMAPILAGDALAKGWSETRAVVHSEEAPDVPKGMARSRARTHKQEGRGWFVGKAVLPHLGDPSAAPEVHMILSDAAGDYADCWLAAEDDSDEMDAVVYRVDARSRGENLNPKKGMCDVDLTAPDVQPGVPAAKAGDHVRVVVKDAAGDLEVLGGDFSQKH